MITYLLATGFSEVQISSMRVLSVIFELAATWIAPMLMARMGAVRSGLWFINWQLTWVAASIVVFTILNTDPRFAALGLVVGVILSRMGLWGFDLCVQYIIQEVSLLPVLEKSDLLISASHRAFLRTIEGDILQWKQRSKISSNYSLLQLPWYLHDLNSSGILFSRVLEPS